LGGIGIVKEKFLYEDLTYEVIGAAMEVHRELGSGFLEAVYEEALAHELTIRKIPFQRQKFLSVGYKGLSVGEYRADFVIDDKVVVELKAVKKLLPEHEAQLINYLKATSLRVGLLLNLGTPSLEKLRRIV
jgi:GxxExxY protein